MLTLQTGWSRCIDVAASCADNIVRHWIGRGIQLWGWEVGLGRGHLRVRCVVGHPDNDHHVGTGSRPNR